MGKFNFIKLLNALDGKAVVLQKVISNHNVYKIDALDDNILNRDGEKCYVNGTEEKKEF